MTDMTTTKTKLPQEGCTRCHCGAKYWDGDICHSCGTKWDGFDYTDETAAIFNRGKAYYNGRAGEQ